ncbi:GNAT family N-acetyltransferase [Halobacteriovorax sp. GB3]|uniref:GNAT family N-acetyltransferase n=1 Tax=Halobacteriovorax sp. GB3 TaxID=2719615 RepID=UPI002361E503|nr:GNAT family N-acetyltransferase [Halobacteriovorax sp. GB3]MDD0854318.1 GNAT family N-acetyltransferase [Halobacteriovorax sp. GB3]
MDESFIIECVSSEVFFDGFKEESNEEFQEFLHSGNSIFYSEEEKERYRSIKPDFKDEAFLYFIVKRDDVVVARSFSNQISIDTIMMCMSYVKKDFRGRGLYKLMLQETIERAKDIGYRKIQSYHNTTNNDIIIPKLKAGFVFTGMKINAGYGTLAELTYFFNKDERDAVDFRTGYRRPSKKVSEVFNLSMCEV